MNATFSTGVEMELWVVDDRGRLRDGGALAAAHDRIEPEFVDPLLEVQTEPHDRLPDLRRDLQSVLSPAIDAADAMDRRLVPLGTPFSAADPPANCERGRLYERIYGDGVRSAENCAGTHVHFEQTDVVRQLNLLTALDPALAFVSSSPYYVSDRRHRCSHAGAYRRDCGTAFREFCGLRPYVDSVEAWQDRVDEAYENFLELEADREVDRSTVEAYFDPEDPVLNPVRLRRCQPTVEWRPPDSTLPSHVLGLVGDVRELVDRVGTTPVEVGDPGTDGERVGSPTFPALRDVSRGAVERGLDSRRVRGYLESFGLDPDSYRPVSGGSPAPARAPNRRHASVDSSTPGDSAGTSSPWPGSRGLGSSIASHSLPDGRFPRVRTGRTLYPGRVNSTETAHRTCNRRLVVFPRRRTRM